MLLRAAAAAAAWKSDVGSFVQGVVEVRYLRGGNWEGGDCDKGDSFGGFWCSEFVGEKFSGLAEWIIEL